MTRLDRHVSAVRNKLAMHLFVDSLGWALLAAGSVIVLGLLIDRLAGFHLPVGSRGLLISGTVLLVGVIAYAIWRRPSAQNAAVAIDGKLQLKEKFSTALYARSMNDPFARAAVDDAEQAATTIRLQNQFPLTFPKQGYSALAVALLAVLVFYFLPHMDLFGREQAQADQKKAAQSAIADAEKRVERALDFVAAAPPSLLKDSAFAAKVAELKQLASAKAEDPGRMTRKAEDVLKDVEAANKDEADRTREIASAQTSTLTQAMGITSDTKGPVSQVAKSMSEGDFAAAMKNLESTVKQFDKMDAKEKADTAKQMDKLAKALEKAAEDPKVQEQIQKQLQQLGADKDQAQQMAKDMAKAAQGDKQAQQNLQNQAQQMQKNLQNQIQQAQQQAAAGNQAAAQQLGQLQQQQQAINQAMQQMQGMANAQAQAGNMSQAAQQMAQGMQQAAQGGQGQQPGQQPGQQGNQAGQQQVAQGQQQMQNALNQMQAVQADANAAAARQAAGQGQPGNQGQGDGQGPGQQANAGQANPGGGQPGQGEGEFQQGDPAQGQQAGGMGGPGIGNGQRTRNKAFAPFTAKAEDDLGVSREEGQILASTLVKDGKMLKGESKAKLQKITQSKDKAITDEVEEDRVSGASRKAAEEYFRVMDDDSKK